jgi:hypothetical protein
MMIKITILVVVLLVLLSSSSIDAVPKQGWLGEESQYMLVCSDMTSCTWLTELMRAHGQVCAEGDLVRLIRKVKRLHSRDEGSAFDDFIGGPLVRFFESKECVYRTEAKSEHSLGVPPERISGGAIATAGFYVTYADCSGGFNAPCAPEVLADFMAKQHKHLRVIHLTNKHTLFTALSVVGRANRLARLTTATAPMIARRLSTLADMAGARQSHWQKSLEAANLDVLHVDVEELVAEPDVVAKRILDFLDVSEPRHTLVGRNHERAVRVPHPLTLFSHLPHWRTVETLLREDEKIAKQIEVANSIESQYYGY